MSCIVGKMGLFCLGNVADFALPNGDEPFFTIHIGGQPGTGLELERIALLAERPNTGNGRFQMLHHRFSTGLQHGLERYRAREGLPHGGTKAGKLHLQLLKLLHLLLFGSIAGNA